MERLSRRHLLPYERRITAWVLTREEAHPSSLVRRQQDKYGPEGQALLIAGRVSLALAFWLLLIGMALLVASGGSGGLLITGYSFLGMAVCSGLLAMARGIQASKAAKQFH
jgi:hypothetical protein